MTKFDGLDFLCQDYSSPSFQEGALSSEPECKYFKRKLSILYEFGAVESDANYAIENNSQLAVYLGLGEKARARITEWATGSTATVDSAPRERFRRTT